MIASTPIYRSQYAIWLGVALLIIVGGLIFCWLTTRSLNQQLRQGLGQEKAAGRLPPEWRDIDPEKADPSKLGDFMMKLPWGLETRLQISYWLTDLWYVWSPLVVLICLAIAKFIEWRRAQVPA